MKYEKSENSQWTFFFSLNPHTPLFGFGTRKTTEECVYALPPSHLPWKKKKDLCLAVIVHQKGMVFLLALARPL